MSKHRHINAELRKENSGLSSQIKVLESEIKIHLAEIEDLKEVRSYRVLSRSMPLYLTRNFFDVDYEEPREDT